MGRAREKGAGGMRSAGRRTVAELLTGDTRPARLKFVTENLALRRAWSEGTHDEVHHAESSPKHHGVVASACDLDGLGRGAKHAAGAGGTGRDRAGQRRRRGQRGASAAPAMYPRHSPTVAWPLGRRTGGAGRCRRASGDRPRPGLEGSRGPVGPAATGSTGAVHARAVRGDHLGGLREARGLRGPGEPLDAAGTGSRSDETRDRGHDFPPDISIVF
jgi:hypothetical protein